MGQKTETDVLVIGGGVAGRSAGIFTARAGLDTLLVTTGESLLRKNAHLENFPGFPRGVNPRLLLEMMRDQAERAGCHFQQAEVVDVDRHRDSGFVVKTADADKWQYRADRIVAATPGSADYLSEMPVETTEENGHTFVETDDYGRTTVDGVYAAGRLARKPLQAIISAGHGAEVATTLLDDADAPVAHDWTVSDGYFTDRGNNVPPGCEEITAEQRAEREQRSLKAMREYFAEPHPDDPVPHPAVEEN